MTRLLRKNACGLSKKSHQAPRHNNYHTRPSTPHNFYSSKCIDHVIDVLAEQWRDDYMCAPKDYYVRKLNQLRHLILVAASFPHSSGPDITNLFWTNPKETLGIQEQFYAQLLGLLQ